jgi:hypothetical protein
MRSHVVSFVSGSFAIAKGAFRELRILLLEKATWLRWGLNDEMQGLSAKRMTKQKDRLMIIFIPV